ncbi:MAG: hypothetical protein JXR73_21645 [Candidatus Omnitrophica bacterium]|nr:hypothetical protein [Candidatus Omnitrophota bacterium]
MKQKSFFINSVFCVLFFLFSSYGVASCEMEFLTPMISPSSAPESPLHSSLNVLTADNGMESPSEIRAPMLQKEIPVKAKSAIPGSEQLNLDGRQALSSHLVDSTAIFKPAGDELNDKPLATIHDKNLGELSGVAPASGRDEYWGHNDKGNDPEIYRFNLRGEILQKVVLKNVKNDDWEAIERDGDGNLIIGAFGDNNEKRDEYRLYSFPEPGRSVKKIDHFQIFRFVYSDRKSHNCEAFFICGRKLYLVTKEKKKKDHPILFCIQKFDDNAMNIAEEIGTFNITGKVTDAAYSSDNQILALMTYSGIALYRVQTAAGFLFNLIKYVPTDFNQCEGLCLDGDSLIISNESGDLWKYSMDFFLE